MPRARAACVAALCIFAVLPACTTPGLRPVDRASWALTAVDIDSSHMENAGALPIFRQSDSVGFNRAPTAVGSIQRSDSGLVSVKVEFREIIVGFSGQTVEHKYEIISIVGKMSEDGTLIVAEGPIPNDVRLGTVTEIHVDRVSDTRVRLQPATRGKLLPYVFIFEAGGASGRAVTIPLDP